MCKPPIVIPYVAAVALLPGIPSDDTCERSYAASDQMLMPIVAIVGIIELVPAVSRLVEHRATRWIAIGLGAGLAVVVLVGAYPTLLSELARRSTL